MGCRAGRKWSSSAGFTNCSPCEVDGLCPNGVACMTDLQPDIAFDLFEETRAIRSRPSGE